MSPATADREARFERIFASHHGDIERYAVRRAVSPDLANDAVSETFLVAWRRLDDVPDEALPWLYATARGVLSNQHRTARRSGRLTERLAAGWMEASREGTQDECDGAFLGALARLSEPDREALLLVAWEELSRAEAARSLGISRAAFAARLLRARARLRRLLDQHEHAKHDASAGTPARPVGGPR